MGKFVYEGAVRAEFDDRALTHLQVVIGNKLRRGEPFFFTWHGDVSTGGGRTTVWMHAGANIVFTYYGKRQAGTNRTWLEALMHTANSPGGLQVMPEPPDTGGSEPALG